MNSTARLRHIYLGISAVAALLVFVVDVATPPGIAMWPFYLIPLAIAAPRLAARGIYLMSAVVTALIVLGTLLSPPGIVPQFALINDGVGIALLWGATWLAVRRLRVVDSMRRHEQELDELVKSKTDELRAALAKYAVLFEVAPVGVSIADAAGNIVESNLEARKILDAACQLQLGDTFQARARVDNLEVEIIADDGSTQWLTVNAAPIPLPGYGAAIVCTDITARKQMEGQLRESGEQYRFLTENIKDVIWTVDLATRQFTYISPSVTKMRGFAPAEIVGQPATSGMTSASARYVDELLDTLVAEFNAQGWTISPEFHSADIEELCKDGSTIWSEAVALIRRNAQTGGLELHGVTRDISQRKQLQDALRESEHRYRMLADHATDVIWSLDAKLDYSYVSPAVTQVTGYSPEEFMHYRMAELLTPASAQFLNDQVAQVWEASERTGQLPRKLKLELEQVCRDGHIIWIEMIASAAFDASGAFAGVVGVSRDITERKRQEEEIRRLNADLELRVAARTAELAEANLRLEERVAERTRELDDARRSAEEANQAKSRFLANMSHELRTPLNAIVGLAQVMQDDPTLSPVQQENLSIVVQSSEHLLSMINEVLDISKIEAGKMDLHAADFDLHATIHTLQAMLQQKADARQIALAVEVAPEVPRYVHADQGKLRQVLINLLNNALKFTHEGHVTLKVRSAPPTPVVFEVEDTGPGIAPAELDQLFNEFEQTAAGRLSQEGTGLGLPISRRLVQMMGGDLTVSSRLGQGTTFTVRVPLPPAAAERADGTDAQVVKGLAPGSPDYRILIVDDIFVNREVLKRTLRPLGLAIREAEDGPTALTTWEQWRPQLIWLDIRMAGMSGIDVAQAIRQREREIGGTRTCIIAITASVFAGEHASILAAGCDDIVAKPFRRRQIFDKLAEHLGLQYEYDPVRRTQQPAAEQAEAPANHSWEPTGIGPSRAAAKAPPASGPVRVLVVDDNIVGQKLAVRMLEKLQVKADVAGNGEEALAVLAAHPYPLVLMDMQMPVMGGIEATRRIRAREGNHRPVIVALTGSTDADDFSAAQSAGIDGWLVKPLRIEDLRLTLERWLLRPAPVSPSDPSYGERR